MAVMARMLFLAAGACVAACGGSEEGGLYSTAKGGAGGAAGTSVGGGAGSGGSASGGAAGMASGGAAGSGASAATGGSGGSGGTGATSSGGGTGGGSGGGPPGIGTGPCGALSCAFSAGDACCKADGKPLYCSNTKLSNPCKCSGVVCHEIGDQVRRTRRLLSGQGVLRREGPRVLHLGPARMSGDLHQRPSGCDAARGVSSRGQGLRVRDGMLARFGVAPGLCDVRAQVSAG